MKVVLNGETFDFDDSKRAMSEAMTIERLYKRKYVQWQQDLATGELEAWCMYAWIVWRREGRDVEYQNIVDGHVDFDLEEFVGSINAARRQPDAEAEAEPDPTGQSDPDGTPGTGTGTSESSPSA